jgi:hypothetical protein
MKVLVFVIMSIFIIGCGVNTDSSDGQLPSSSTDGNGTDSNTSDTNGTTDGNGSTVTVDDSSDSGFSKTDAEEDSNACVINGVFQTLDDSSFDPNAAADATKGVEIASQYAYSTDLEATKVVLFYPTLSAAKLDSQYHIYEDNYRFSYNKAWSSNNVARVYIRTPKDIYGAYSCYRYELDSQSGDQITKTKVYR